MTRLSSRLLIAGTMSTVISPVGLTRGVTSSVMP